LRIHLDVARLLLRTTSQDELDAIVFTVTHHLNLASSLVTDLAERDVLVRLNVDAGRKAMIATSYEAALGYFRRAGALLEDKGGWRSDYELTFALHKAWTECAHLAGQIESARRLRDVLLSHAVDEVQAGHVHLLWIELATSRGQFMEAIARARRSTPWG
jgi:predicted ATPase